MSGILVYFTKNQGKNLSGKSCLKLFIVSCITALCCLKEITLPVLSVHLAAAAAAWREVPNNQCCSGMLLPQYIPARTCSPVTSSGNKTAAIKHQLFQVSVLSASPSCALIRTTLWFIIYWYISVNNTSVIYGEITIKIIGEPIQ